LLLSAPKVKIVACIKQVPDTTEVRIAPQTNTLVREGVPAALNPLDLYAVEGAVRLREQMGGEVIALSMGPPQAEAVLREAIARGCDRGVLLSDAAFAGSDTWATSYALACAVRRIGGVDVVLCGKQAVDGDTAQVGPGLAAHLGCAQATYVRKIVSADDSHLLVECLTDRAIETYRLRLPAVLTVLKDLNEPRLPSLVSQMRARRCAIARWGADDLRCDKRYLGLDGSPTRVLKVFAPPSRAGGRVWEGNPSEAAGRLVKALAEMGLL